MKAMKVVTAVVIGGTSYITARGAAHAYASTIEHRRYQRAGRCDAKYWPNIEKANRRLTPIFKKILP